MSDQDSSSNPEGDTHNAESAAAGRAVIAYLAYVAKLVIVTVLVVLAGFNIALPFVRFVVIDRGAVVAQANEALASSITKEELAFISPFLLLSSKSREYTSTTTKVFLDSLAEFVRSLEAQGIQLPDALDPRFFSPKSSGVVMFRQVNEIPAQVVRPLPR